MVGRGLTRAGCASVLLGPAHTTHPPARPPHPRLPQSIALREGLAAAHEACEEWGEAARALAGIDIESGERRCLFLFLPVPSFLAFSCPCLGMHSGLGAVV